MCGITGTFWLGGSLPIHNIETAVRASADAMRRRGPDGSGTAAHGRGALGHARLAVIDTTEAASQPFFDRTGRYMIAFNGEIFNYRELRRELEQAGEVFRSQSDTEVLLYAYLRWGRACLSRLNGFFAFAVYDTEAQTLFAARDRMGVKPLVYSIIGSQLCFASELKALLAYQPKKKLCKEALLIYLQHNYVPAPYTMFENIWKLLPGHCLEASADGWKTEPYYDLPLFDPSAPIPTYSDAQAELRTLLEDAVKMRLVSDVPLGSFLSGGIDSTVVSGLAARHQSHFQTFSVGYRDEPYYDETSYARAAAKSFGTEHTIFSLTNNDLYEHLDGVLSYLDEPFADSSALPVYILSQLTRKHVTVALSGDGADELFGGYRKHAAHAQAASLGCLRPLAQLAAPLLAALPQSRASKGADAVRKASRFASGLALKPAERYWRWCALMDEKQAFSLLPNAPIESYKQAQQEMFQRWGIGKSLQSVLRSDLKHVLPNDMLAKVDLMSMANSLEVRTPFLDYRMVAFAARMPEEYKIGGGMKKRILQDAFRDLLPAEIYNRPKHGFEVPLLAWMRGELKDRICSHWLNPERIKAQGIFDPAGIEQIKAKLFSNNPGDSTGQIWGLIVFHQWMDLYFDN